MPTWPSRQQLNIDEKRLIELTDSQSAPNVVDEEIVETLRVEAVGLVESYCTTYVIPFTSPPANVRRWAADVWRFLLYSRRPDLGIPEDVRADYQAAMRALEKVAAGTLPLGAAQVPSSVPTSETAGGLVENVERKFGRGRDGLG